MAMTTEKMDDLLKEYLLFRGFTGTLKSFETELKTDKDKSFRVDKMMQHILLCISTFDLIGLREYWAHLERRFFSRLEYAQSTSIRKLETSSLRYYLVHAIHSNRHDKVMDFFDKLSPELQPYPEWKDWFVLPFIRNPEQNPLFENYFSKQWFEIFTVSLHNFLNVILHSMPVPALLNFETEYEKMNKLQDKSDMLKEQVDALQRRELDRVNIQTNETNSKLFSSIEILDDFYLIPQQTAVAGGRQAKNSGFFKGITSPLPGKKGGIKTGLLSQMTKASTIQVPSQITDTKNSPVSGRKFDYRTQTSTTDKQQRRDGGENKERPARKSLEGTPTVPVPDLNRDSRSKSCRQSSSRDSYRTAIIRSTSDSGSNSSDKSTTTTTTTQQQPVELMISSQVQYKEHNAPITYCRFSPSGNLVASADYSGCVRVWNHEQAAHTQASIVAKSLCSVEWVSKQDRLLLLGTNTGTVKVLDVDGNKSLGEWSSDSLTSYPRILSLACHPCGTGFVCSAASSNRPSNTDDNHSLNSSVEQHYPSKLLYWNLKYMKVERDLNLGSTSVCVNCTSFNHNGNLMVVGSTDGVIRLFDMHTYDCLLQWHAHTSEVYTVQFSVDETSVYSMGSDCLFVQWSIHGIGKPLAQYIIHTGATGPFIWNPSSSVKQVLTPRSRLFALEMEGQQVLTCSPTDGGIIYKLESDNKLVRTQSVGSNTSPVVTVDWYSTNHTISCSLTGSLEGIICATNLRK